MDRFFRGLLAGMAGAIPMNIWSFISFHFVGLADRRIADWASIMLFGSPPNTLLELFLAIFAQILWSGFLGILFAYLVINITSRGYLLKGAFYGFITGFIIFSIPTVLQSPYLARTSTGTATSQLIGGVLWGVTMAYTLKWLDNRVKTG